jgi:hypothetical protein
MPGKMTKSNSSITIPTTPGTSSRPQLASTLREGRKAQIFTSARESSGESRLTTHLRAFDQPRSLAFNRHCNRSCSRQ